MNCCVVCEGCVGVGLLNRVACLKDLDGWEDTE